MHKEWNEERWEALLRNALEKRLESAAPYRPEVQWQRLRQRLESEVRHRRLRIGPWPLSRLGLVACCVLVVVTVLPLAFSDQIAGLGDRLFGPAALQEDTGPIAREEALGEAEFTQKARQDTQDKELFVREAPDSRDGAAAPADGDEFRALAVPSATEPDTPATEAEGPSLTADVGGPARVQNGLTISEARAKVPFAMRFPRDLPSGFGLVDVTYEPHSPGSGKIILFFDHPDGRYLRIEQQPASDPLEDQPSYTDGTAQPVAVRGRVGTIVVRNEDWSELFWLEDHLAIRMWGQLTAAEIAGVAESLVILPGATENP